VRIAVVAAVVLTVVAVAVISDPSHDSWHAKTWQFVHHVAAASVGHR
jgi:hypothetical protein